MKRDLLSKANADMMTLETLLRNLMLTAVQPTSELEKRNVVGHISIILERHIKGKSNCEPMSVRTVGRLDTLSKYAGLSSLNHLSLNLKS